MFVLDRLLGRFRAAPPPTRRPRALVAWEFGAGRTHVANVLGVVRQLRRAGFDCLAALYETETDNEFAALGVSTVQNYVWPSWRRHQLQPSLPPDKTLSDFVAQLGFISPKALSSAIAHYDGLFRTFEPDILLCENAFGGLLAARGRLPAIAFGFSGLLPPIVDDGFPSYFPDARAPSLSEEWVCGRINEGLARAGRLPIENIGDILRVDAVLPFGPDAFDVYARHRQTPCLPVHLPLDPSRLDVGRGDAVFVYLQAYVQEMPAIMAAVMSLRRPVHGYLPDLSDDNRALLARHGVVLEDQPIPMGELFARSRTLLHHGGQNLTAACLAAGLPQTILSKEYDNRVTGDFVTGRGLGDAVWYADATTSWIVDSVRRGCEDEDLRARCRDASTEFKGWFAGDPSAAVAEAACRILGRPPPPTT